MKWGYFPYVLSGDGGTLQLYYLSVPKNGDIEAVRKSLADRKDPTPVSTFEKINLPSLPTSIPAGHLLEYKLAAKTREIEALKNKVSALEKVPPNPVSVEKPAALFSQPIPVVTNHKIVEDAWIVNGEFDYGAKVSFDVTNIGEAGVIEVAVNLTSSEGNWVRKEKRYFEKGEKKNLSGVFTEITVESKISNTKSTAQNRTHMNSDNAIETWDRLYEQALSLVKIADLEIRSKRTESEFLGHLYLGYKYLMLNNYFIGVKKKHGQEILDHSAMLPTKRVRSVAIYF